MAALTVRGATVRIGPVTILDDVSAEFPAATVTALIGPNGAGKSTLLAVAAGTRRPDRGTVLLGGADIARLGVRELARRRAVMPQNTSVAFPFTVREVVAMGRAAQGGAGRIYDEIIDDALDLAGVRQFAERPVGTLSGGEHQRVALARVVAQAAPVGDRSVILLDEPTAAMDIAHAETTMALAQDLASRGAAVGVVLHDLDAAAAYGQRLILLDRGRVRAAGTVAEVCSAPLLSEVYRTPIEVFERGGRLRVGPRRAA